MELYEPELLPVPSANHDHLRGKPQSVINLCSYNYLGFANHPEVIAAAHEALRPTEWGRAVRPCFPG